MVILSTGLKRLNNGEVIMKTKKYPSPNHHVIKSYAYRKHKGQLKVAKIQRLVTFINKKNVSNLLEYRNGGGPDHNFKDHS